MVEKTERRKPQKKRSIWHRRVKQAMAFATIVFLASFATVFIMFLLKLREAEEALQTPEFQDRMDAVTRPPTRILTADGVLLYRVSSENRLPVNDIQDIPKRVRDAVMAAEDKRFYEHPGVDSMGLARAFVSIFKDGRVSQGGSTLTMQLAKLLYNGNEKSFRRKVEDIAYAYAIEKYKTKDQILLLYLNKVYFGEGAHGIKAAAKVYFNKPLKDLTVGESAMLARCIQRPSQYNPIKTPKEAIENRNVVLNIMRDQRMIDDAAYRHALAEVPKINKNPPQTTAQRGNFGQHFVEHVLASIREDPDLKNLDLKTGGYTIYTTIDSQLQKHAEQVVRDVVRENRFDRVNQGMFVAMDNDGRIRCEVGGTSFERNQFNIVTQGIRQPGSAFKAILYSVGLLTGNIYGPGDYLSNAPITVVDSRGKVWSPRNASPRENAPGYDVESAFKLSVNRPAMHLIERIGPKVVVSYAHDVFGIKSELWPGLPLAIGSSAVHPIEMLEAYSVFMTHGDRVTPRCITKVESPSGDIVKTYDSEIAAGVLPVGVCATMDELMRAVVTSGTGTKALPVPNARGKTGTTNDARDAWFCGYTDGLVGVGWVGNQRKVGNQLIQLPMASSVYGGTVTAGMWARIMKVAYEKYSAPPAEKAVPQGTYAAAIPNKKPEEDIVPALKKTEPESKPVDTPVLPEEDPKPGPANILPGPPVDIQPDPDKQPADARKAEEDRQKQAKAEEDRLRRAEEARKRREQAREERRRQQQDGTVTLEVCADSGMLATAYCPETVTRTYRRSDAPNRRCKLHGP